MSPNYINNAIYATLEYKHEFDITSEVPWADDFKVGGKVISAWAPSRNLDIDFTEITGVANLPHVVNQSRFLIVPWVRVKNLASTILSLSVRRMRQDWRDQYAVEPWLVETLVDPARYRGDCYRAANWILVGTTSGRGRMDRGHLRHGAQPKSVWVFALARAARARLCRGGGNDAGVGNPQ